MICLIATRIRGTQMTDADDKPITSGRQGKSPPTADKPATTTEAPTLTDAIPESELELDQDAVTIPILTEVVGQRDKNQKDTLPKTASGSVAPIANPVKPDRKDIPTLVKKVADPTDSESD